MSDEGASGTDRERIDWVFAPVACAALLTAGAIAGVVRGLRYGGRSDCGGIPLPRCSWLTSRWAVRIAAWGALTAGLADLIIASSFFRYSWHEAIGPWLLSLVLVTYMLLGAAPLIGVMGLQWRDMPQVHGAFLLVAKIALLGGLAAGLASELVCEVWEAPQDVGLEWRKGCATLGTSSGLLLLGLYGAQADFQGDLGSNVPERHIDEEENWQLPTGRQWSMRLRFPSWRGTPDFDFPAVGSLRSGSIGTPLLATDSQNSSSQAPRRELPPPVRSTTSAGPVFHREELRAPRIDRTASAEIHAAEAWRLRAGCGLQEQRWSPDSPVVIPQPVLTQ